MNIQTDDLECATYFAVWERVNCLPNNKFWNQTKLKAFADDKLIVAVMTISAFDRLENTGGKGENAGYQHFPPFLQCFPKPPS